MASVVSSFWKNKKVFLTGHTGFKGSWMSLWLHKMGAQVTGYALQPPTNPSLFEAAGIASLIQSHIGDIRDFENLKKVLSDAKPDIIIHMAAQPLVRYSYSNPIETYMTNVMGTVYLLEAAKAVPSIRAIVNVTTDKCYENKEWHWGYRENEALGGYDPYSSSKACSELVTSAYRQSFKIAVASARAGNVIGGGDWAEDRLIPDIIKSFSKNESVKVRNPNSIRPWQHVLEPLCGYLVLAQKLFEQGADYAQAFNFGPTESDAREVEWIVKKMVGMWGGDAAYTLTKDPNAVHEATYLKLDHSKARTLLQWEPRWGLEKTLESIVTWSKAYASNKTQCREVTLRQIEEYEKFLG
ncbi:CDP-glucose 4,6-dehydratase [Bdellovibrio sp. HCB337]|uniref:CDP-glucose 4,6-dehydratase n=1 Tax=Bdellovibrio sp. HCB337 TaxID=3394358 RepID=UPI0039A6C5E9